MLMVDGQSLMLLVSVAWSRRHGCEGWWFPVVGFRSLG
jgi:hypothetical protein